MAAGAAILAGGIPMIRNFGVTPVLEIPINWLAAQGIVRRNIEDWGAFNELDADIFKRVAKKLKQETGIKHGHALHCVARALNFEDFNHYVEHMSRKGLWATRKQRDKQKAVTKVARRQGWLAAQKVGLL
jgi:hypothetical protein